MPFPDCIQAFPGLNVPFPEDVVSARAVRSDAGLVVFFSFHKDMLLPMHAHGSQRGSVIEGEIEFTIGGDTRTCFPATATPSRRASSTEPGSRPERG
jgi:hypothetical protein